MIITSFDYSDLVHRLGSSKNYESVSITANKTNQDEKLILEAMAKKCTHIFGHLGMQRYSNYGKQHSYVGIRNEVTFIEEGEKIGRAHV